jgi:hypothetical protein
VVETWRYMGLDTLAKIGFGIAQVVAADTPEEVNGI